MPFARRALRFIAPLLFVVPAAAAQNPAASASQTPSAGIPAKLSDSAFWKLVTDFSEGNGYFQSDNFVSNETTFQWVIPALLKSTRPGGAYLGVGWIWHAGDAGDLLRLGTPAWMLVLFGVAAAAAGLVLWHRCRWLTAAGTLRFPQ